jgi:hypothetical protein
MYKRMACCAAASKGWDGFISQLGRTFFFDGLASFPVRTSCLLLGFQYIVFLLVYCFLKGHRMWCAQTGPMLHAASSC